MNRLIVRGQQLVKLKAIKSFANKLPIVPSVYEAYANRRRSKMSTQELFTEYFQRNSWQGADSASGPGSDLEQTKVISQELPLLLKRLGVSTMLDAPCGDFYWMRFVDLGDVKYIGADIVPELISRNRKYELNQITFIHANLLIDDLPKVDLIFSRDCLVHFSYADIERALKNFCDSGSEYLLTTTYPGVSPNINITTGEWRALNLQITPFNLPAPLQILVEGCTEANVRSRAKSLGLWRVADLGHATNH